MRKRAVTESKRLAVSKAQGDPVWWMENGCGWKLWEAQRTIARALVHHERVAVPAAFGVGKTYLAGRLALWFLMNHYPAKVITTAPTGRQVKELLWAEIRDAFRSSKRPLQGEPLTAKLELEDQWFATGFTTEEDKPDKFSGYHSPNLLVIFDQAAGIDRSIWEAAEALMTSSGCKWLAISNTTDASSVMADVCLPDRKSEFGEWHVIPITAHDSPNVIAGKDVIPGIIGHDWIEKRRKVWKATDPLWRIFVEAEFVEESTMTVLTNRQIIEALESKPAPDFEDIQIGLDVADEGADSSVWCVRAGQRLLFLEQVHGNDPMQVVAKTEEVCERIKHLTGSEVNLITVDKIGIGSGIASRLGEIGYPVDAVNVSKKAEDPEQFLNIRAELAWGLRDLLEEKRMSLNPYYPTFDKYLEDLKEELTIRYHLIPATGRIQLEKKKMTKKRIRRSPDFWDAVMLCFGDAEPAVAISVLTPKREELVPKKERYTMTEWMKLSGQSALEEDDFVSLEEGGISPASAFAMGLDSEDEEDY